MASQVNPDMIKRLDRLEARIQTLEDTNAIRNLKARYAELCDDNYNPDGIAAVFVEDAVWDSGPLGHFEGREAIREFFRGASRIFTLANPYSLNSQIEVTGDTARAKWYLFMPCSVSDGDQAMWRAGIDEEEYVRMNGHWMFKSKVSTGLFNTPFGSGWNKVRFA
jgi:ketosteroid isomerase-like protein